MPPAAYLRRHRRLLAAGGLALIFALSGCGTTSLHDGRLPFSLMEKPPSRIKRPVSSSSAQPAKMEAVARHDSASGAPSDPALHAIRSGDIIAFHMSHRDAWRHLRRGGIQKIPYELFRYGHIALVVPHENEPRLLQVAMKQPVNAVESLDYLRDKSWTVYRPAGRVDPERLDEFTRIVTTTAADPSKAYDYSGALGFSNAPWQPSGREEIGSEYTCTTLVIAALHYAGYELHAVHRGGKLDVVTPRQVVESLGNPR